MQYPAFVTIALLLPALQAKAANETWAARTDCVIAKRNYDGLVPDALAALHELGVEHRITQTINPGTAPSNYHGRDLAIEGRDVTAAVDISVRCLDAPNIKRLLSHLALAGFAGWYREEGKDGWKGPTHIHAVWASEPLKRQLQKQIASWLGGRTGLVGDARYMYWQPTDTEKATVAERYEASKAASSK